ncbi:MAG: SEC-C metal-binding domain-containing protein, partial [Planctomycetota bacterium]|nr:SEC-C metal-binding domain-containing protein [Planctomycetota bacterium]
SGQQGQAEGQQSAAAAPERQAAKQQARPAQRSPVPGGPPSMHRIPRAGQKAPGVPAVERNEPCPCGSGKKFKKCHGAGQ